MRKFFTILTMTIGLLGPMTNRADAQTIGPYCFSLLPFSGTYVFFFTPNGANHYIGTGRALLSPDTPMSSTMYITGGTAVISFIGNITPTGTGHTFFGSANVSTSAGTGPGRCETLNTGTGGCGQGSAITMAVVACPAGSLTAQAPLSVPLPPGAHLMDGSK